MSGPAAVVLARDEDLALWRALGLGPRPTLLATPDHGATLAERDAADRRALQRLRDTGRLPAAGRPRDGRRDGPDVAAVLGVLARPAVEVDARVAAPTGDTALLGAGRGDVAVVARRDADGRLHLLVDPGAASAAALLGAGTDPAPAVVDGLVDALPAHPGGPGPPVRIPGDVVLGHGEPERAARVGALRPTPRRTLQALLAEPPVRVLRLGAARRGPDGRARAPEVLTVVDTAAGRVRVRRVGDAVELRPLSRGALRRELLALVPPGRAP